ncbi:hypothetical protein BDW66DRAFT_11464 [Aspergillus desertorum]
MRRQEGQGLKLEGQKKGLEKSCWRPDAALTREVARTFSAFCLLSESRPLHHSLRIQHSLHGRLARTIALDLCFFFFSPSSNQVLQPDSIAQSLRPRVAGLFPSHRAIRIASLRGGDFRGTR